MLGVIKHEETLSPRIMIAIGLAICGGVLVSWSSTQTQAGFQGGELLVLGAVILWTWYSRVSVTRLLVIPAYPRTVLTLLGGASVPDSGAARSRRGWLVRSECAVVGV